MPRPILRGYQQTAMVAPLRQAFADGYVAPMVVGPCGSGKTTVFAEIAYGAQEKGRSVAILAHRIELIDQIENSIEKEQLNENEIINISLDNNLFLTSGSRSPVIIFLN